MDVILQIFKWNINPDTPFFKSLMKKPPIIMDDLFRWVDKYSILEDDVRATSLQVLVTNQTAKNDKTKSSKPSSQTRQDGRKKDNWQQQ